MTVTQHENMKVWRIAFLSGGIISLGVFLFFIYQIFILDNNNVVESLSSQFGSVYLAIIGISIFILLFIVAFVTFPFKSLYILVTISFLLSWVPFGSGYDLVNASGAVLLAIILVFNIPYYVFLGMLASRKNRSIIKWVGLTIIFQIIGNLVSYVLIITAKPLEKNQ